MALSVCVFKGDITEQKADACVSSLHRTKDMRQGPLARAILHKGGPSVQRELNNQGNKELSFGEVVTSPPGNLNNVTVIMFVCLLDWRDGNEKVLFKSVVECLKLASQKNLRSIVFPALGMGGLHYPPFEVAMALMEGIKEYVCTLTESSLETVYIALHDANADSVRTFVQGMMAFRRGMAAERDLATAGRGQESWLQICGREALDEFARTRPELPSSARNAPALAPLLQTGLETAASLARSLPHSAIPLDGPCGSVGITPSFSLKEGTANIGINVNINVARLMKAVFQFTKEKVKSCLRKS